MTRAVPTHPLLTTSKRRGAPPKWALPQFFPKGQRANPQGSLLGCPKQTEGERGWVLLMFSRPPDSTPGYVFPCWLLGQLKLRLLCGGRSLERFIRGEHGDRSRGGLLFCGHNYDEHECVFSHVLDRAEGKCSPYALLGALELPFHQILGGCSFRTLAQLPRHLVGGSIESGTNPWNRK